ncbi:MAG TPA: hypothetical protein VHK91_03875, partial [Flavisolibacter sp.]|nr:hypothetical protein [Flavisolibacter sp.]
VMPNPILLVILISCIGFSASGQNPISNVIIDNTMANTGTTYQLTDSIYNFGNLSGTTNNYQVLTGFILPSGTYYYNIYSGGIVKIRRVNNAIATGNRCLVWMQSNELTKTFNIFPAYNDQMESFLNGRILNLGTDNLFGNQGDGSGNNNNIERVDWITANGMSALSINESGFAIFERGADNQHDPFCLAPILSLNASGDPSSYGRIVRVATSNYGNIPNSSLNYSILRKEEAEPRLYRTTSGNQQRGGVYISFADMGISPGQVIYGYSLFANDLPAGATASNLLDYTNTTFFPTNTSSNTTQGGIDLIAVTGLFSTTTALPVRYRKWTATGQGDQVQLEWELENPGECSRIQVERSRDGNRWELMATLTGRESRWLDKDQYKEAYYRLKLFNVTGTVTLTENRKIIMGSHSISRLTVNADPHEWQIKWLASKKDKGILQIYTLAGNQVLEQALEIQSGWNRFSIPKKMESKVIIKITTDSDRKVVTGLF